MRFKSKIEENFNEEIFNACYEDSKEGLAVNVPWYQWAKDGVKTDSFEDKRAIIKGIYQNKHLTLISSTDTITDEVMVYALGSINGLSLNIHFIMFRNDINGSKAWIYDFWGSFKDVVDELGLNNWYTKLVGPSMQQFMKGKYEPVEGRDLKGDVGQDIVTIRSPYGWDE